MKKLAKKAKRVLALLLTLALCMSLLNLATFAASESSYCGIKEHTHTDECYETRITDTLICGKEATKGHTHDEDCYEMQTVEDAQEVLDCDLEESEGHTHVESCYSKPELTCELEETEGHTHSEDCYDEDGNLTCGLVESEGHSHGEGCYGDPELTCGLEESEGHTHTADCYTTEIVEVKETVLTCEQEESEAHEHTDACYATEKVLVCTTPEHIHGESCSWVRDADQLKTAIAAGGIVTLGDDISVSSTIDIRRSVTLDLNGYTVTYDGAAPTLDDAGAWNGSVFMVTGGTFTLRDSVGGGMITGGKGSYVDESVYNGTTVVAYAHTVGGGVCVTGGTFTMEGGAIEGNTAGAGGGIYVAKEAKLNFNGGSVSYNEATYSYNKSGADAGGGGIWINGTAVINPTKGDVYIQGNTSATTSDLGGGGIYVNSGAKLDLTNAVITGNTAQGLGGGIAACVHGKVSLVSVNGSIVYSNTANGTEHVVNPQTFTSITNKGYTDVGAYVDGYDYWKNNVDFIDAAQDLFSAGSFELGANNDGQSGSIVSNERYDRDVHNWAGWVKDTQNGQFQQVSAVNDGYIYGGFLLALTAQNTSAPNLYGHKVLISGNESATHGGGIGCNGTLTLGNVLASVQSSEIIGALTLDVTKTLEGAEISRNSFEFELLDANGNVLDSARSDRTGNLTLTYSGGILTSSLKDGATYTFYVREVDNGGKFAYDDTVYKIMVTVASAGSTSNKVGDLETTVYKYEIDDVTYEAGTGVGSSWTAKEGSSSDEIVFTNTALFDLTVTKKVEWDESSNAPTDGRSFTFDVTIGDGEEVVATSIGASKPADYYYDGVYQVTLKAGESATITGIPAGTEYTVVETTDMEGIDYAYKSGAVKDAEPLTADTTVTVVNTYDNVKQGYVSVTKVLSLDDVERNEGFDQEFTFAVYAGTDTSAEPVATLTVKAGETATTGALDYGIYTIVETNGDELVDYTYSDVHFAGVEDADDEADGFQVFVSEQDATYAVTATNSYERHTGDLSITKTVEGDLGDKNREWHFTVTLESPEEYVQLATSYKVTAPADVEVTVFDEDGTETTATERQDVTSSLTFTQQNDGTYVSEEITLKHGETATIKGIPVGTAYEVTEKEANQGGYTTTSTNADDVIVQDGAEVEFTNSNWSIPTTSLTINKVWDDEGNEDARPDSIQVQIYRNGSAYKEVTLSAANNWRHTESGLSTSFVWTAEEINVPDGYTASTVKNGTRVTITNTYEEVEEEPEEPEDPEDPEEPENPEEPEEFEEFEIEDPEVPLANMPEKPEELEEFEIEDPDVPLANVPKTGDTIGFWEMLAALSAMGLALLLGKRKKEEEA